MKSDPKTIDAVLTYAMRGHGRRTNLYTEHTLPFGREELVTFAKATRGYRWNQKGGQFATKYHRSF